MTIGGPRQRVKDPGGRFKIGTGEYPTTSPSTPRKSPPSPERGRAFERFFDQTYAQFAPEEIEYQAKSEEEIRNSIAGWLQPGYDEAISERKELTQQNNANLDADAIARGMGASTYVTDVKNRQQNAESSDIASLRANYGATLSKNVFDSMNAENEHVLEVKEFNAQQRQQAYEMAYQAALVLFEQYLKNPQKGKDLFTPTPHPEMGKRPGIVIFPRDGQRRVR